MQAAVELGWPAGTGSLWERDRHCDQVGTRAGAATWELQPAAKWEEQRELATLWLLLPWWEMVTAVRSWNGQCSSLSSAVCAALLQPSLLLTLASPPSILLAPFTASPRQNPAYLPSSPRGAGGLQVSLLVERMPAPWDHLIRWYVWEKKESFSFSLFFWFKSENKI